LIARTPSTYLAHGMRVTVSISTREDPLLVAYWFGGARSPNVDWHQRHGVVAEDVDYLYSYSVSPWLVVGVRGALELKLAVCSGAKTLPFVFKDVGTGPLILVDNKFFAPGAAQEDCQARRRELRCPGRQDQAAIPECSQNRLRADARGGRATRVGFAWSGWTPACSRS